MSIKYRCPKDSDHKDFLAKAKVVQEWLCNDEGEFVKTVTECVDVLHSPEELALVCRHCGSAAEEYDTESGEREAGYRRLYGWMPHPSKIRGFEKYENEIDFGAAGGHTPQTSSARFCVNFHKISIGDREIDDVDGAHNATAAMHLGWLTFEDGWRAFVWDKKENVGWSYEYVGPGWEEDFEDPDENTPSEQVEEVPDVVDALREQDWSGWSIGDQGTLVLHGKAGDMVAQISEQTTDSKNRIFKASIHPGTLKVKSAHDKSLADAIAWCEDNFNN